MFLMGRSAFSLKTSGLQSSYCSAGTGRRARARRRRGPLVKRGAAQLSHIRAELCAALLTTMHHTHCKLDVAPIRASIVFALAAVAAACTGGPPVAEAPSSTAPAATSAKSSELRTMTARFAPADIVADVGALPDGERRALARLVEAARLMDSLFLRQVWAGNDALLQRLSRDAVG